MSRLLRTFVFTSLASIFCVACVPQDRHHGHELNSSALSQLKIGKSTKEDVVEALGNPSCTSTFSDNTWYYVNMLRTGCTAFKKGLSQHKVIALTFQDNVLRSIKNHANSKQVPDFHKGKTPLHGDNMGTFDDFVNNLGGVGGKGAK